MRPERYPAEPGSREWLASGHDVGKPLAVASPARGAASDNAGGEVGPAAIKGGVLIFVALVLGTFLLWRGTDSDLGLASAPDAPGVPTNGAVVAPDEPDGTDVGDEPDDGEDPTDGEPTEPAPGPDDEPDDATEARPPGEVTVQVANGSGIPGVAGLLGTEIEQEGYSITEATNAKVPVTTSTVHYIDGFEAEAAALAATLGLDPSADGVVAEMPSPLPTTSENLEGANLLVIAGPDIAPAA